ncbi:AraC family transcriptional regulator [Microvirga sp. 2MCAF38]|uniref:AraC family transcriptional regulator n=1 Tax=Microvirga sp. 2MCAF38 TaxID=3232989 RepID=UPI003F9B290B
MRAGLRISPLLRKAGLPPTLVKDERVRVDVREQIVFLNLVAHALDDPLLGFHLARDADLRELGPLYYVMASSQKLGDAFDIAARYSAVVNEGIRTITSRRANAFSVEFDYVGVERHLDRHQMMFWITYTLKAARFLTKRELTPLDVSFVHQNDADPAEMERYFECVIRFGAPRDRISFDARAVDLPLVTEDEYLNRFMVRYCQEAAGRLAWSENPLRTRVENAIVPRLQDGSASLGTIANDLGLSPRTLSRKLATDDLSFSTILDELRSDLSYRYLQNYDLSISQIAWLLGYTEVSSFVHAFQRWAGRSPTDARRAIKGVMDRSASGTS